MSTPVTIPEIVKAAGGPAAIVRASLELGCELTRDAVYKWRITGIPDRHWQAIIGLTDLTPTELYVANCHARGVAGLNPREAAA